MNPPEKIGFPHEISLGYMDGLFIANNHIEGVTQKYVLAPVWKDAVKDPPKEDRCYPVAWKDGRMEIQKYELGGWFYWHNEDAEWYPCGRYEPDFYYPLSEPPKEEE